MKVFQLDSLHVLTEQGIYPRLWPGSVESHTRRRYPAPIFRFGSGAPAQLAPLAAAPPERALFRHGDLTVRVPAEVAGSSWVSGVSGAWLDALAHPSNARSSSIPGQFLPGFTGTPADRVRNRAPVAALSHRRVRWTHQLQHVFPLLIGHDPINGYWMGRLLLVIAISCLLGVDRLLP